MADLEKFLPKIQYEIVDSDFDASDPSQFKTVIRVKLVENDDVKRWMSSFEELTKTKWDVRSTKTCNAESRYVFSRDYVCHHSNYRKTEGSKKSKKCPASLSIRIKRDNKDTRYRDPFVRRGLCAVVTIENRHSHLVENAEAWKWLGRTDSTRADFLQYFRSGKSPAEARLFHEDLLMSEGFEKLADSSINPPEKWIYKLHDKWRKENFGDPTVTPNFIRIAMDRMAQLQEQGHLVTIQETPFALSVVTPLMQRVLKVVAADFPTSFFLDTSSSCDQINTALTLVLVATKAGAVPVGVSLHDSQSEASYETVFRQLKNIWCSVIPTVPIANFMTDDSAALKNALLTVWPDVRQLLCVFHVSQAVWRWLWDGRHSIAKQDRQSLMQNFCKLIRASSSEDAEFILTGLMDTCCYEQFSKYLNKLWVRKEEWCFAYRLDVVNRGNNTNNYAEATFRVIKDIILTRLKAYNSLALLDFVVVVLEKYYCGRLLKASFGRLEKPYLIYQKVQDKGMEIVNRQADAVTAVDDDCYLVRSCKGDGSTYDINCAVGICSCFSGKQGGYCKHQAAVHIVTGKTFPNSPALSAQDKMQLYTVATGKEADMTSSFFDSMTAMHTRPLNQESLSAEIANNIETCEIETLATSTSTCAMACQNSVSCGCDSSLLQAEVSRLSKMLNDNISDQALVKAANKFTATLQQISTPMQLYQFFTAAQGSATRHGRLIRVQPTSTARRGEGATRGSARHRAGRPLSSVSRRGIKRPRSLGANVADNRPNAKSHGDAH